MKKQIINCESGEVEVIDISQEEESVLLQTSAEAEFIAQQPKPKTAEQRIADLEEQIKQLTQK